MELTKRSNFKLDATNVGTTDVVIKKGLKAIDFVGVVVEFSDPSSGKQFALITGAVDGLDGNVTFAIGPVAYNYDPATGQITAASSDSDPDDGDDGTT